MPAYARWAEAERKLKETPALFQLPNGTVQGEAFLEVAIIADLRPVFPGERNRCTRPGVRRPASAEARLLRVGNIHACVMKRP